jgi:hypothetical protein
VRGVEEEVEDQENGLEINEAIPSMEKRRNQSDVNSMSLWKSWRMTTSVGSKGGKWG